MWEQCSYFFNEPRVFLGKHVLLSLLLLFSGLYCSENKIIYLISPPRSMSVAFTRMMQERGDFEIFHEPSMYAYDRIHYPEVTASWFRKGAFFSFDEVKQQLLTQHKNVFVKEMSFAVEDFLIDDHGFVQNPKSYFLFLIRNPHHVALSFYNKVKSIPDRLDYLLGYKAEYSIFEFVKKHAQNQPIIILTEDLYQFPEKTIRALCQRLELPHIPESLHWSDLGADFTGENEWHEIKVHLHTHHWHGDAIRSTGFNKPHSYEVDIEGQPTFAEIQDENLRRAYQTAYSNNLFFYNKLISERDYILSIE